MAGTHERPYHARVRTLTVLALAAVLVVAPATVSADSRPTTDLASVAAAPMLQASPAASPGGASPAPELSPVPSPVVSPVPSIDPCASPIPDESPAASAAPSAIPSAAPAPSAAPSPAPSVAHASAVPVSPAASAAPTIVPCPAASPDPTDEPGVGFQPGKVKLDLVKIADGLDQPTYVTGTQDGTGRLFVTERTGRVLILDPTTGKIKPFLDIRDRVDGSFGERGLHAIAPDPHYAKNGYVYVHYNSANGDTNVVRFTGKPGAGPAKTSTAKQILRFTQPFENHNGGWLGFGPDGRLYLALGDGGGNSPGDPLGNGQDRGQPLAKILRVDPATGRYSTYAWGLRNP